MTKKLPRPFHQTIVGCASNDTPGSKFLGSIFYHAQSGIRLFLGLGLLRLFLAQFQQNSLANVKPYSSVEVCSQSIRSYWLA
jgi:hypothetical protein